jgi:hypothetical protein
MKTKPKHEARPSFISEEEMTLSLLGRALEPFINTEGYDEDVGGLHFEETLDCPVWIEIDHDDRFIILKTCRVAGMFGNRQEALNWVNAANEQMGLVQFHVADGRIWGRHWISCVDGLNIPQLIETMRRFSASFVAGVMIQLEHA